MRQPPDIDFAGQRPPFQDIYALKPINIRHKIENFCGWAVANEKFAAAPCSVSSEVYTYSVVKDAPSSTMLSTFTTQFFDLSTSSLPPV